MNKKIVSLFFLCIFIFSIYIDIFSNTKVNSQLRVKPYINVEKYAVTNHSSGYTPSQIRHAYNIDKLTSQGKGQKIAVIVPYGSLTIRNDLDVFNTEYDLEPAELQIVYPQGEPDTPDNYDAWAIETSLDVEWVHALAPKASILLVVAKSDTISDLIYAIDYATSEGANVISMSWGTEEFETEDSYESHFNNPNIIFVSSAGNSGFGVNWPAVSAHVLSVGGTTLPLDFEGNLIGEEIAWRGSCGGVSSYILKPSYQVDCKLDSNIYRAVPDVSFCADRSKGVAVYCSNTYNISGWSISGGTSLGAPAWAAFAAIIKENNNISAGKFLNQLYKLGKSSVYFRDIISGKNGINSASKGYDYLTGLGSPLENEIFNEITKRNNNIFKNEFSKILFTLIKRSKFHTHLNDVLDNDNSINNTSK